ncbi:GerAB/ArcD/ProY family transporter [Niallia sp. FSL R7-0271]|uniref:GerAB/ArcD/ProY family transporter n=1 Tax=Niallia sp. FSL R7-0271 TaxID=2921678 RepID=UPI0030FABE3E
MIVFMCILPLVGNIHKSRIIYLFSIIFSGLFLTLTSLLITASLGSRIALRANFPLLSATRLVSNGEFIERMDVITVFMIMLLSVGKKLGVYIRRTKRAGIYISASLSLFCYARYFYRFYVFHIHQQIFR